METKVCNKCFEEKPLDSFHRDKGKKDGLCTICKSCKRDNAKSWRLANLDYARKKGLEYYHEKKQCSDFRQKRRDNEKAWRARNLDRKAAQEAGRRSCKLNATPPWLTGPHKAQIARLYALSGLMREITGEPHHVDHIVPLQGKNVCGLHVPWNLQVLPAKDNLRKSNSHD